MSWSIGNDSGQWCVEPIVPLAAHARPDFNGHWFASTDSGWGMEILDVNISGGAPTIIVYMYYPGPNGQPAWATASGTLTDGPANTHTAANMQLLQISNGYCRTCPPPTQGLAGNPIGSITLKFDPPPSSGGGAATGSATFHAAYPVGGGFNRTDIPISMLSVPTGQ